ncbi:hypothetical protein GTY75_17155 [Streptomyces sp. SID8381]|uniref:hypothetical protein n=1 Tax=unclassified Streptomyces TaxID=2593676 RepID=UPI00036C8158|nr:MULTISPECIES: hypothetical protein [unclassified Streptomyces]MYX28350.1 hypothetical protein [Streptomyces sp. SID8381]
MHRPTVSGGGLPEYRRRPPGVPAAATWSTGGGARPANLHRPLIRLAALALAVTAPAVHIRRGRRPART